MTIQHSFSHFHLKIKALLMQTSSISSNLAETPGIWFNLQEIKALGIAKPVSLIIQSFKDKIC